jgi:hypothetical protein
MSLGDFSCLGSYQSGNSSYKVPVLNNSNKLIDDNVASTNQKIQNSVSFTPVPFDFCDSTTESDDISNLPPAPKIPILRIEIPRARVLLPRSVVDSFFSSIESPNRPKNSPSPERTRIFSSLPFSLWVDPSSSSSYQQSTQKRVSRPEVESVQSDGVEDDVPADDNANASQVSDTLAKRQRYNNVSEDESEFSLLDHMAGGVEYEAVSSLLTLSFGFSDLNISSPKVRTPD